MTCTLQYLSDLPSSRSAQPPSAPASRLAAEQARPRLGTGAGPFLCLEYSAPGCPEGQLHLSQVFAQISLPQQGLEEVRVTPANGMSLAGILEVATMELLQHTSSSVRREAVSWGEPHARPVWISPPCIPAGLLHDCHQGDLGFLPPVLLGGPF